MTKAEHGKARRRQAGRLAIRTSLAVLLFVSLGDAQAQQAAQPQPSLFSQHAHQAGLKACAEAYPALGAMVTQGATYNVASSWNHAAPDAHPIRGLVGIALDAPQYHGPGAGVVVAAPGPAGCGGAAVRILPFPQPCAEIGRQLPAGSKLVQDLSGTLLYAIGGDRGQVMLLTGQAGCIAISVNQMG